MAQGANTTLFPTVIFPVPRTRLCQTPLITHVTHAKGEVSQILAGFTSQVRNVTLINRTAGSIRVQGMDTIRLGQIGLFAVYAKHTELICYAASAFRDRRNIASRQFFSKEGLQTG